MDVFSLEEDDGNELFLTQSSNSDKQVNPNFGILGDSSDFSSPCVSLVRPVYEDISEDEFEFPSTQQRFGSSYKRDR